MFHCIGGSRMMNDVGRKVGLACCIVLLVVYEDFGELEVSVGM